MNDNSIELIRGSFAEFQEDQNIKGAFKTGKVKKCKDIFLFCLTPRKNAEIKMPNSIVIKLCRKDSICKNIVEISFFH